MRVLFIWPAGMAPSAQDRLNAMVDAGVEVGLVCAKSWPEGGAIAQASAVDASYPVFPRWAALTGRGAYYTYPMGVSAPVRRFRPDLIHLREEMYTVFAGQFLLERKIRFPHIPFVFESWQNIRKRYPWPARSFERGGYRNAAGAIAGAPSVEGVLRAGGFRQPIQVIPLGGVNLSRYSSEGEPMRTPGGYVGYAGRLTAEKGLDLLVDALSMMSPRPTLLIAGDGPQRSQLVAHADQKGVRLEDLGPVSQEEIPAFLRSLDVLVLPSRTTERWKEQWGRVLTEAMACGVPVVGSSSGEIPHVIGDAGVIFPEGSSEGLRRVLTELMHDVELRERLVEKGLRRAEELSWPRLAEETVSFYKRVLP